MTDQDALTVCLGDGDFLPVATPDRITVAQLNLLTRKTPPRYVKQRKGRGGQVFDYVEINYVLGVLNATFGLDWDAEVIDKIIDMEHDCIAMQVRLSVRFAGGQVVKKDAWGGSDIKRIKDSNRRLVDLADDLKSAESDAIKKAASMLGVAWDVYSGLTRDDDDNAEWQGHKTTGGTSPDPSPAPHPTINMKLGSGKVVTVGKFDALKYFGLVKEAIGEETYYEVLSSFKFNHANEIPLDMIQAVYNVMVTAYRQKGKTDASNPLS